ncbi:hypothetical protein [Loktanella salsilacus]|uniref:hypothetical protein n=1 Tax=Loktanella salsilacus TaxID=195913 RepID=UPI003735F65A
MILSRTLARRRIAAGVRPGWLAAWLLVICDTVILLALLAGAIWLGYSPLMALPVWARIITLFVLFFVPLQLVLITSSMWATRSRWQDTAPPQPDPH